ncbi:MAG: UDP-N-acetylmuramoyl-tripeptide--D-alanyl-D-alanine ligase [Candidatus Omnitrophota bacterium]
MFRSGELVKVCRGKLICGRPEAAFEGISLDSRLIKPEQAFLAIKGKNFDGHNFIAEAINKGAKCIIAEPKIEPALLCQKQAAIITVKDTIRALGDIARHHRKKFNLPVIVVTGSNGKTTTKEMIAWVMSAGFKVLKNQGTKNNQIGLPQALLGLDDSYDLAVLEAGTSHFGEIDYLGKIACPNIGVIINIGPSHLERLKNLAGVFREKTALLKCLLAPKIAIVNYDDSLLRKLSYSKKSRPMIFGFGLRHKSDFSARHVRLVGAKVEFLLRQQKFCLNTLGLFNASNALAAIALARVFGMEYSLIAERLESFSFLRNRLNLMEINHLKFINDTYNSNPLSLDQALDALNSLQAKGRKIFVMGDMLELGQEKDAFHRQAGLKAAGTCNLFVTVGDLSRKAAEAARSCGFEAGNIYSCATNLEAREVLYKKISPGPDDVILVKGSRGMRMEEIFND